MLNSFIYEKVILEWLQKIQYKMIQYQMIQYQMIQYQNIQYQNIQFLKDPMIKRSIIKRSKIKIGSFYIRYFNFGSFVATSKYLFLEALEFYLISSCFISFNTFLQKEYSPWSSICL